MTKRNKPAATPPGDVRAFRAFEDYSGANALVDVRVDGQTYTYSMTYMGADESGDTVWLISSGGTRRGSKIAASMARRAFAHRLLAETTPEYRARTLAFYNQPEQGEELIEQSVSPEHCAR